VLRSPLIHLYANVLLTIGYIRPGTGGTDD